MRRGDYKGRARGSEKGFLPIHVRGRGYFSDSAVVSLSRKPENSPGAIRARPKIILQSQRRRHEEVNAICREEDDLKVLIVSRCPTCKRAGYMLHRAKSKRVTGWTIHSCEHFLMVRLDSIVSYEDTRDSVTRKGDPPR